MKNSKYLETLQSISDDLILHIDAKHTDKTSGMPVDLMSNLNRYVKSIEPFERMKLFGITGFNVGSRTPIDVLLKIRGHIESVLAQQNPATRQPNSTFAESIEDLVGLFIREFPHNSLPAHIAKALVDYMFERGLIAKKGRHFEIRGKVGVVLVDNQSSNALVAAVYDDAAAHKYSELSSWVAYFFKEPLSHSFGCGIEEFVGITPIVACQTVGDRITMMIEEYEAGLNSWRPSIRPIAHILIGFLVDSNWALLQTLAEELLPQDREKISKGVRRWSNVPFPTSDTADVRDGRIEDLGPEQNNFRCQLDIIGNDVDLQFGDENRTFRKTIGFLHLALLLQNPKKDLSPFDFRPPQLIDESQAKDSKEEFGYELQVNAETAQGSSGVPMGEKIDSKAILEYKSRRSDIEREIKQIKSNGDITSTEDLEVERQQIEDALSAGMGLHGEPRREQTAKENAQRAVKKAIDRALLKIESKMPELASHFSDKIKKGPEFTYSADLQWFVNVS